MKLTVARPLKIDRVDPVTLIHGANSLVFVEGRCHERVRGEIEVALGDISVRATRIGSRFVAILPAHPDLALGTHPVRAVLSLVRADHVDELAVEVTKLDASAVLPSALARGQAPLVGICLTTFEPRIDLFRRQIESIREQSHQRFVCVICDDCSSSGAWRQIEAIVAEDPRFICCRSPTRLGFFRNFERCLTLVPPEADLIALADQDDYWHPNKISTLVGVIGDEPADLIFSDMRLVDDSGRLLSSTFWTHARNNFSSLDDLLLTNSVTGAASLFRRELLDVALPFPPAVPGSYHDHWLACVALAAGGISYVDTPLYDYVQHSANASGRVVLSGSYEGGFAAILRRFIRSPWLSAQRGLANAATTYAYEALRIELFAQTLEVRLGTRLRPRDAITLRRGARLLQSREAFLWLLGRSLRDPRGNGNTLGLENHLLKAIIWRHAHFVLKYVLRSR